MIPLPLDIVRLIIHNLYDEARRDCQERTIGGPPQVRLPDYRHLLALALVSKSFAAEVQALLFKDVALTPPSRGSYGNTAIASRNRGQKTVVEAKKVAVVKVFAGLEVSIITSVPLPPIPASKVGMLSPPKLYWALSSPNRVSLCATVRTLRLSALAYSNHVGQLIAACTSLHELVLLVKDMEKDDCLGALIQSALSKARSIKVVRLLHPTSIKSVEVVYSLPYRLAKLVIEGMNTYRGALWENEPEWLDVQELVLARSKLEGWDAYFFLLLCEQHSRTPPKTLRVQAGVVDLPSLPEATAKALTTLDFEDAQPLLHLKDLERFENVENLSLSAKHDFILGDEDLPNIRRVRIPVMTEEMCKLWIKWLSRGMFSELEEMEVQKVAWKPALRRGDAACMHSMEMERFEQILVARKIRYNIA